MFGRRKKTAVPAAVTRGWTYRYAGVEITVTAATASAALEALREETGARAAREAHLISMR